MLATLNKNSGMLFSVLLAGAFGVIVAELSGIGHTAQVRQYGFIAAIVGAVVSLLSAFVPVRIVKIISAVLLALVAASGLYGASWHSAGQARRDGVIAQLGPQQGPLAGVLNTYNNTPPPLAPLSLTGLGLMSAVASLVGAAQSTARKGE